MEKKFTDEEIKAARSVRDEIITGNMPDEIKSVYMAGEIVMWDELQQLATQQREASKPNESGWVKELVRLRNNLYEAIPTGEINSKTNAAELFWELLQIIKWHINDLDTLATKHESMPLPNKPPESSPNQLQKGENQDELAKEEGLYGEILFSHKNYSVRIRNWFASWQAGFEIGVQTIWVESNIHANPKENTKEYAIWMAGNINSALSNLLEEVEETAKSFRGYSLLRISELEKQLSDKDKEVDRLKGLLIKEFNKSATYMSTKNRLMACEKFKTDNNL